jgi:DNA-binding transcriptional LysR family regulator
MDIRELGRLDMNLLVALEALLEERNVSKAAERLFITQSAMSKTLGRLRDLFDDPLFIRKSSGMVPTPRATQLAEHLPQVLQAVQAMIQPAQFDPLSYDGEFELMVQGHMGVWILPLLLERLRETAPLIRLRTLAVCEKPLEMLAAGELDFVLHAELKSYPADYSLATLGYAQPVLLARKGHPLEGKQLTWEMLAEYPHVRLIIPEFSNIQFQGQIKSLQLRGPAKSLEDSEFFQRESEVVPQLQTDHLYTALRVVLTSDHLFPAPPLFMEQDGLTEDLIALPLPGDEEITITYVMVSHERIRHSAAHEFMRGEILEIIERFRHKYGLPCLEDLRDRHKLPY